MRSSIRARMTSGFAIFIAGLMLSVCAAFYAYSEHTERQDADAILQHSAAEMRADLSERLARNHHDSPLQTLRRQDDDLREAGVAALIVDSNRRIVARTPRAMFGWPHDADWRLMSFSSGAYQVVLGVPWRKTERALRKRTLALAGLSGLVILVSAAGAWFLVGRTLSPIDSLARQAQTASAASLHVRLQPPSPDAEIARLVATLNDLLARLGETAASHGRFYAAASHELRTPLQALAGHLEVGLSRERPNEDLRSALEEAHAQTNRLTSLVQALLALHQLDVATVQPTPQTLDLADVCDRALSGQTALIKQRGLTVEAHLPDAWLEAPPAHTEILVRNLVENAVKYAPPHSSIRVCIKALAAETTLEVWNRCDGFCDEEADLNRWFEPFFRPDAARGAQGGNGLGLAICRAVAQANDWQLSLHRQDAGLSAVVIFLARRVD